MFDDLFKDTKIKSLNPLALGASGDRVRCFMQKNNQSEDMAPFRGKKTLLQHRPNGSMLQCYLAKRILDWNHTSC